jgi:pyruvate,water dikinase
MHRASIPDWERVFGGLFSGMEGLESVKPVRAVVALAERLAQEGETAEFRNAFDAYLHAYGDRTLEELKFEVPSFREEPERLMDLVRSYAASRVNVDKMRAREQQLLRESETALETALRGRPFRRFIIRALVSRCRRLLFTREKARFDRARYFGILRRLFDAVGEKLVAARTLRAKTDIHQLFIDEVWDASLGRLSANDTKARVAKRRAEIALLGGAEPESRLVLKPGWTGPIPARRRANECRPNGVIIGLGSSPGVAIAPAIVIHDPAQARDVAGKILVAEITDPGWVFLMIGAAGLVVEKGSLLSHTAIIGRELGLPTVIGAAGATTAIRSGDTVRIDGGAGEVRFRSPI